MRRTPFNDGWSVRPKTNRFAELAGETAPWTPVTLPHDAMIGTPRSPSASAATGFFRPGVWEYRRTLHLPAGDAGTTVVLAFEGVYRDAVVCVNDTVAAHRPYGYSNFFVAIEHLLRVGEPNEIRVEARAHDDSRWYPGAGIHRDVWLLQAGRVHLTPDGLDVRTPEIDDDGAVVVVAAVVRNASVATSHPTLRADVIDADGRLVTTAETPVTTFPGDCLTVRQRLFVPRAHRWSPDDPYLYRCRVTLLDGGDVFDDDSTAFGIRSLALDPQRGLRINGEPVLLRGACIHHDNGPIGTATIGRAEERRVELLQAAGFNAIRSAHNPMSSAMLDACDRLGMLVMDETFDMWTVSKSDDDYALRFEQWWEADVEAMVRKDVNHPSVILYSIGNEIPDGSAPAGARRGRAIAEKVRSLDDTRFVTQAVTGFLVAGREIGEEIRRTLTDGTVSVPAGEETGVNTMATVLGDAMTRAMRAQFVTDKTAEAFSCLDVAGYNYMETRFELDRELFPQRVIVATETHPPAIDTGWSAVTRIPQVIGDFTWTGWDYLGEAGIGRVEYGEPPSAFGMAAFQGAYPWLTAWCGDLDITGHRRPQSYYREIVFGLRADPYVAVRPPAHHGEPIAASTPWSWSDAVASWTWPGFEQEPVVVEVYADADEVELLVNGRSLARAAVGPARRYRAEIETRYEPGTLEAVAFRGGAEIGRASLRSASGRLQLRAEVDRDEIGADPSDLAFVTLTLVDEQGTTDTSADRKVTVELDGPAALQGFASADPRSEECFTDAWCTTFGGRALAVVRPTGPGVITLTAVADGCDPQHVRVVAR